MYIHRAATFDYKAYQKEIHQLTELVDQGTYNALYNHACKSLQCLSNKWPLLEFGSIPTTDKIGDPSNPVPSEVGFWFFLIMAEYLRPCPSPREYYGILESTLGLLGWTQHDRQLLFEGLPTHILLKPELEGRPPSPLTDSSPYWFRLRPWAARWWGWLPIKEIKRLYRQLQQEHLKNKIAQFDVRQLRIPDVEDPLLIQNYQTWLQTAYCDTLAMLVDAGESEQGLFMNIRLASY